MEKSRVKLVLDLNDSESVSSTMSIYDYDNEKVDLQILLGSCKDEDSCDYEEEINIPIKGAHVLRKIGIYADLTCQYKRRHNRLIMNKMKLLGPGVRAIILDGKNLRTTQSLMRCQRLIKKITIVEINNESYSLMKNKIKDHPKIELVKGHLYEYIVDHFNPKTNLIYLDLMSNYFNSENTFGTQSYLTKILMTLTSEKILFAATFCMRTNTSGMTFGKQQRCIILDFKEKCNLYNFKYISLLNEESILYKGQKGCPMLFILYMLDKVKDN